MEQIEANGIQIYPLPDCDDDEDEEYKEQCRQLKVTRSSSIHDCAICEVFVLALVAFPIAENEVDP